MEAMDGAFPNPLGMIGMGDTEGVGVTLPSLEDRGGEDFGGGVGGSVVGAVAGSCSF